MYIRKYPVRLKPKMERIHEGGESVPVTAEGYGVLIDPDPPELVLR